MPRNAFRLHTNRHGNPYSFTIGNSMRALFIDVKAHAGYHLIFCASKYYFTRRCICRLTCSMLSSNTKTHGILTHKNLTNVVTQILQILYRAVTLYPIYSLLKESQQTIYRFFLQKTKHGSNGSC